MGLRKPAVLLLSLAAILVFAQGIFAMQSCSDASRTINVKKGEKFTVVLKSNPTTGYQWQLSRPLDSRLLKLLSHRYVPSEPQRTGSGGEERWTFSAAGRGKTTIGFNYLRPWEKDTPPVETKNFTVNIR